MAFLPARHDRRAATGRRMAVISAGAGHSAAHAIPVHAKPVFLLRKGGGKGVATACRRVPGARPPEPTLLALAVFVVVLWRTRLRVARIADGGGRRCRRSSLRHRARGSRCSSVSRGDRGVRVLDASAEHGAAAQRRGASVLADRCWACHPDCSSARSSPPAAWRGHAECALMRCAVIGAGAWGTALARLLADNGHDVRLWAYEPDVVEAINASTRERALPAGRRCPSALRGHELAPPRRWRAPSWWCTPRRLSTLRGIAAAGARVRGAGRHAGRGDARGSSAGRSR